jgi:hypothetical protein
MGWVLNVSDFHARVAEYLKTVCLHLDITGVAIPVLMTKAKLINLFFGEFVIQNMSHRQATRIEIGMTSVDISSWIRQELGSAALAALFHFLVYAALILEGAIEFSLI